MEGNDALPVIVVDLGMAECRAGFAGEDTPRLTFPPVVGSPRIGVEDDGARYVGHEPERRRGSVLRRNVLRDGFIDWWEGVELVWRHIFSELGAQPEERSVLLTEAPFTPKANREKATQIMLQEICVAGLYMVGPAPLALYALGRATGLVVDCGLCATHAVPVYEGHALAHGTIRIPLGGRDVNHALMKLMGVRGYSWDTQWDAEAVSESIKRRMCYVALDFDVEKENPKSMEDVETSWPLPGGCSYLLGSERFRGPEALFTPSFLNMECAGIHDATYNAILKCEAEIRERLYGGVLLCGGQSMLPGLAERLEKELKSLAPLSVEVQVHAPPKRSNSAWVGGSMLASRREFRRMIITASEYSETGPSIVHRKCF